MKICRSSKTTLKFATKKKRALIKRILTEYSKVVNFFIAYFWDKNLSKRDILKEIVNLSETWLSARMRQCAAREALDMVNNAKKAAGSKGVDPIKPVHCGKKMTLSAQIVTIETGRNSAIYLLLQRKRQ